MMIDKREDWTQRAWELLGLCRECLVNGSGCNRALH